MNDQQLTIRLTSPDDATALRWLAALDSAPQLGGRVLLAELDGVPAAALALDSGSVTADPFQHTEAAVRMLTLRRYQLMRQGGDMATARSLLRRLVPTQS
jgi:uncharacterized protein involved in outer membrane biogenesis